MKYNIFYGGREITPPDNISKIYHGSTLIWERASSLIPDTTLAGYRFTRTGTLIPTSIYGDSVTTYDLEQQPSIYNIKGIFSDSESTEFVWSDTPAYRVQSTADTTYAKLTGDYVELKNSEFARQSMNLAVSDTASQWDMYTSSVRNFVKLNKAAIAAPAGSGIYPLSRPMGFLIGKSEISPLCYVKDGELTTDAGYVVLAVCGDSLICAEGIYFRSTAVYGKITERTLSGELVRTIYDSNQRVLTYATDSKPRDFYKVKDYLFSYSYSSVADGQLYIQDLTDSTKTARKDKSTGPIPENIFCYGDTWYCIPRTGVCIYKGSSPFTMTEPVYLSDTDWGEYIVCYADSMGCYYVDEQAGVLYVIGKSKKSVEKGANYKLFKLPLEVKGNE